MSSMSDLWEEEWVARASCRGMPLKIFYPTDASPGEAIATCIRCPVSDECLEYALTHPPDYGIWGGTTARDRRKILRERKLNARRSGKEEGENRRL
jgi:WhiB family redox-sensing transcriptional regulator